MLRDKGSVCVRVYFVVSYIDPFIKLVRLGLFLRGFFY